MKKYKGSTLVGSLIAIAILSIALIPLLNLQIGIDQLKYDKKYDNTANLLMSEGLEIVRAMYDYNLKTPGLGRDWSTNIITAGNYAVDYNSNIASGLTNPLGATECFDKDSVNNACDLKINGSNGYQLNNGSESQIYRFITITPTPTANPTQIRVKSTVIVKNTKSNTSQTYSAEMILYQMESVVESGIPSIAYNDKNIKQDKVFTHIPTRKEFDEYSA